MVIVPPPLLNNYDEDAPSSPPCPSCIACVDDGRCPPQSNFEAIHLSNMQLEKCAQDVHEGGWVWNWVFNSILPPPDPFGDQEDDASGWVWGF